MVQLCGGKPRTQGGSRAHPNAQEAYSPERYGEDQRAEGVESPPVISLERDATLALGSDVGPTGETYYGQVATTHEEATVLQYQSQGSLYAGSELNPPGCGLCDQPPIYTLLPDVIGLVFDYNTLGDRIALATALAITPSRFTRLLFTRGKRLRPILAVIRLSSFPGRYLCPLNIRQLVDAAVKAGRVTVPFVCYTTAAHLAVGPPQMLPLAFAISDVILCSGEFFTLAGVAVMATYEREDIGVTFGLTLSRNTARGCAAIGCFAKEGCTTVFTVSSDCGQNCLELLEAYSGRARSTVLYQAWVGQHAHQLDIMGTLEAQAPWETAQVGYHYAGDPWAPQHMTLAHDCTVELVSGGLNSRFSEYVGAWRLVGAPVQWHALLSPLQYEKTATGEVLTMQSYNVKTGEIGQVYVASQDQEEGETTCTYRVLNYLFGDVPMSPVTMPELIADTRFELVPLAPGLVLWAGVTTFGLAAAAGNHAVLVSGSHDEAVAYSLRTNVPLIWLHIPLNVAPQDLVGAPKRSHHTSPAPPETPLTLGSTQYAFRAITTAVTTLCPDTDFDLVITSEFRQVLLHTLTFSRDKCLLHLAMPGVRRRARFPDFFVGGPVHEVVRSMGCTALEQLLQCRLRRGGDPWVLDLLDQPEDQTDPPDVVMPPRGVLLPPVTWPSHSSPVQQADTESPFPSQHGISFFTLAMTTDLVGSTTGHEPTEPSDAPSLGYADETEMVITSLDDDFQDPAIINIGAAAPVPLVVVTHVSTATLAPPPVTATFTHAAPVPLAAPVAVVVPRFSDVLMSQVAAAWRATSAHWQAVARPVAVASFHWWWARVLGYHGKVGRFWGDPGRPALSHRAFSPPAAPVAGALETVDADHAHCVAGCRGAQDIPYIPTGLSVLHAVSGQACMLAVRRYLAPYRRTNNLSLASLLSEHRAAYVAVRPNTVWDGVRFSTVGRALKRDRRPGVYVQEPGLPGGRPAHVGVSCDTREAYDRAHRFGGRASPRNVLLLTALSRPRLTLLVVERIFWFLWSRRPRSWATLRVAPAPFPLAAEPPQLELVQEVASPLNYLCSLTSLLPAVPVGLLDWTDTGLFHSAVGLTDTPPRVTPRAALVRRACTTGISVVHTCIAVVGATWPSLASAVCVAVQRARPHSYAARDVLVAWWPRRYLLGQVCDIMSDVCHGSYCSAAVRCVAVLLPCRGLSQAVLTLWDAVAHFHELTRQLESVVVHVSDGDNLAPPNWSGSVVVSSAGVCIHQSTEVHHYMFCSPHMTGRPDSCRCWQARDDTLRREQLLLAGPEGALDTVAVSGGLRAALDLVMAGLVDSQGPTTRAVENALSGVVGYMQNHHVVMSSAMVASVREYLVRHAVFVNSATTARQRSVRGGCVELLAVGQDVCHVVPDADGAWGGPPALLTADGLRHTRLDAAAGTWTFPRLTDPHGRLPGGLDCGSCGRTLRPHQEYCCSRCRNRVTCRVADGHLACGHYLVDGCCVVHGRVVFTTRGIMSPLVEPSPIPAAMLRALLAARPGPNARGPVTPVGVPYIPYLKGMTTEIIPATFVVPGTTKPTTVRYKRFAAVMLAARVRTGVAVRGYGVLFPALPTVVDGSLGSVQATIAKKMVGRPPAPAVIEDVPSWAEFNAWSTHNMQALLGDPVTGPFRAPRIPRSDTVAFAEKWAYPWALSQTGSQRKRKRIRAISAYWGYFRDNDYETTNTPRRDVPTSRHNRCKSAHKLEKGTGHVEAWQEVVSPPAVLQPNCTYTSLSSTLCARALNYFDDGVTDCTLGPQCKAAGKALKVAWGDSSPVYYAFGRDNVTVAAHFHAEWDSTRVHYTGDYKSFDQSQGWSAHTLFGRIMRAYGWFDDHALRSFHACFPQVIKWFGVADITRPIGLASGMVWTSLLNSILNAFITTFAFHKAWLTRRGMLPPGGMAAQNVQDYFSATDSRDGFGGDDGLLNGNAEKAGLEQLVVHNLGQLGYAYSLTARADFSQASFLGSTFVRMRQAAGGTLCTVMIPIPFRFCSTVGWTREHPSAPTEFFAGVALGWSRLLINLPVYGAVLRSMMAAAGFHFTHDGVSWRYERRDITSAMRQGLEEMREEHSVSRSLASMPICTSCPQTTRDLCLAWQVSPGTLGQLESDCTVPSIPFYVGGAHVQTWLHRSLSLA